jgi:hypothetical protein
VSRSYQRRSIGLPLNRSGRQGLHPPPMQTARRGMFVGIQWHLGRFSSRARHRVVPERGGVPHQYNASEAAVDACSAAIAWARRAQCTADAVLWMLHTPSMDRQGHHECMRNAVLDSSLSIPVTAGHQRNYVGSYSRCRRSITYARYCLMMFFIAAHCVGTFQGDNLFRHGRIGHSYAKRANM